MVLKCEQQMYSVKLFARYDISKSTYILWRVPVLTTDEDKGIL